MKTSKNLLSSMITTAQVGQTGIRAVLDTPMRPSLRLALETQLREYDAIEAECRSIAVSRGWELEDLEPAARWMTKIITRARLAGGHTDSKTAGMMIQGCTRGMIRGLRNLHQQAHPDPIVGSLSQRLLDCETAGIRQMQSFL